MKRRTGNADAGKPPRRQSKRTAKFTDSVYGSSYIYIKFFMVWAFIIFADFILEFRFEYLWPLWLLIQSCFETFKCQGLVYSMFFVCIAITSDTICFLFIPIQWLFFMASTYVWIHYVWHTEKGLCLPTALLWFVFMYVEATLRLKDLHNNPFHIELCRPFAAHCIGHPFVTLGIGFKSYISYRLRVRTQRQVQKENNFYYELLKGSLPASVQTANHTLAITGKDKGELPISNGGLHLPSKKNIHHNSNSSGGNEKRNHKDDCHQHGEMQQQATASSTLSSLRSASTPTSKHHNHTNNTTTLNSGGKKSVGSKHHHRRNNNNSTTTSTPAHNHEGGSNNDVAAVVTSSSSSSGKKKNGARRSASQSSSSSELHSSSTNNSNHQRTNSTKSNSSPKSVKNQHHDTITEKPRRSSNKDTTTSTTTTTTIAAANTTQSLPNGHVSNGGVTITTNTSKVELVSTQSLIEILETTISKLNSELNCLKKSEQESKNKIEVITGLEKSARNELKKLKEEHEFLQTKYQNLFSGKQKDKLSIQSMEKRLKTESEVRTSVEKLLQQEIRKLKEQEEMAKNAAAAISSKEKEECEHLRQLKKTLEAEMSTMHDNLRKKEEGYNLLRKEVTHREKSIKESETLMSALEAMQEKNAMLENSLSAETKIKLDLFSALGDAKRQLEIAHRMILKRDSEIAELKSRMTDMVSVMPNSLVRPSTPHYSTSFLEKPSIVRVNHQQDYQANTFCHHPPRTPLPTQLQPVAPMVQATAHNQLGVDQQQQGGMQHLHPIHLDPNALLYAPTTSAH